ncbi:MAG: hypothetical protein JNK16_10445 [Phycisphaerales bacterium]|nr:hypothetical protein [Phycisphaerales bacterium]
MTTSAAPRIQTPRLQRPVRSADEVREIGSELRASLRRLIEVIPDGPHSPSRVARQLGMNRVIASKLLNALSREDVNETLQQIPGPESLRGMTRAAAALGVPRAALESANRAIESFARLIRDDFGTRGALHAAISPQGAQVRQKVELASRYQIFQGIRELLGVEADACLTCMILAPSPDDPQAISNTSIHGAIGMRRLRPDINLHLNFGPPRRAPEDNRQLMKAPVDLSDLYMHDAAPTETRVSGGQLVHRLLQENVGRHASMDMLLVDHDTRGSRRYATPERPKGGGVTFADLPSRVMIFDVLLHDDVFPGSQPELLVYNPGAQGPASPMDRSRDVDRVSVPERVESLEKAAGRFEVPEVPRYGEMIERVCGAYALRPGSLRLYRLRMAYPVHCFQFVMAFEAPAAPA